MSRYVLVFALTFSFVNCTKLYYSTWEAFGKQKRDLLRDQVEGLAKDQQAVNDEFKDALSKLRSLYGSPHTELAAAYDQLEGDFDDAKAKSDALSHRIDKVESIAQDLFAEWDGEIGKLKTPKYKEDSRQKLKLTRQRFAKLQTSMHKAKKDLAPVLGSLEEQVLYLKHNLNAQALGSIQGEVRAIEGDYKSLTSSMQKAISESQSFLKSLNGE